MLGNYDFIADQQTGQSSGDIVGSGTDFGLFVTFNDNGNSSATDGMIGFRLRMDAAGGGAKSKPAFDRVAWIGIDADINGTIDTFLVSTFRVANPKSSFPHPARAVTAPQGRPTLPRYLTRLTPRTPPTTTIGRWTTRWMAERRMCHHSHDRRPGLLRQFHGSIRGCGGVSGDRIDFCHRPIAHAFHCSHFDAGEQHQPGFRRCEWWRHADDLME